MQFLEEVPLAPYTTFQIGGPARWFAEAASEDDIAAGISFAGEGQLPLFVLGGGSNLLVSDAGFPGLVLRIVLRGIESTQGDGRAIVSAAAGEDWTAWWPTPWRQDMRASSVFRHPRHGRRYPGAECRRLRAGGFADHRDGARLRSENQPVCEPYRLRPAGFPTAAAFSTPRSGNATW